MPVSSQEWGRTPGGEQVHRHLLAVGPVEVAVLTYGGIVQSVRVPDRDGESRDIALGFDGLEDYVTSSPWFGAVIGRYANRIAGGRFTLDGREHRVPVNDGPHALHGGPAALDKQVWEASPFEGADAVGLALRHTSPDGAMGFPGELSVTVTYTLAPDPHSPGAVLRVDYEAQTDAPTVVNLTNHSYWNLDGEGAGSVEDHEVLIAASRYTPVDATLIPTGEVAEVAGTPFDFTRPRRVGERIREGHPQLALARGYDHNWVLDRDGDGDGLSLAARVSSALSGVALEVATTEPGMQFYSGNFLDGTLRGPSGRLYRQGDALALETQHWPDSPNRLEFPSTVLRPGETYASTTTFRFSVLAG